MKLWQKIFLWALLTAMLAVSTLGVLLLKNNFKSSMIRQTESTLSVHEYLISNINNRIIAERLRSGSVLLPTKDIANVMKSIFDNSSSKETTSVALFNTSYDFLYNNINIDISNDLLKAVSPNNQTAKQVVKNGRSHYLIIASYISLERQEFIFVSSTDITEIYDLYSAQLDYAKLLSICLSLLCAFILLILVKLLLRPLSNLNNSTHLIANGDYSKRLNIKTNDELGELAHNMNIMADSIEENVTLLQETAENRKQFINNLSHEMKTPLTSILGFADIMRIKRNITPEELAEYSGIIFEEAKRLKSLSGKLMEIITVGETNLEFTEVTASSLFSQLELVFKPIFEKNNMNFSISYDECILCIDLELFKSMLFNIVDNAVKASSKDNTIYINERFTNGIINISVRDEGIGIDKKELNKITEPFYMIDKARSRKAGGAGLGLALCKRISEIHNSRLIIESETGVGTTVTIVMKGLEIDEAKK